MQTKPLKSVDAISISGLNREWTRSSDDEATLHEEECRCRCQIDKSVESVGFEELDEWSLSAVFLTYSHVFISFAT